MSSLYNMLKRKPAVMVAIAKLFNEKEKVHTAADTPQLIKRVLL